MTYEEWAASFYRTKFRSDSLEDDDLRAGWNAALEQAAALMESRKVSASNFYGVEIRKLKA